MRSRDLHILTSGNFSFSSDARFGAQHTPGSDAWTLRLDNARKTDSGKYECQVNTEPKIMYAVQLSVRAPVADIIGPQEQRVPSGSTITLRCVILSPYQTRPIRGVQWLRDNKLLTFQAARGGINVETVRDAARTVSVLTLAAVTQDDVGNYSCRPTEGRSDTVTLVIEEVVWYKRRFFAFSFPRSSFSLLFCCFFLCLFLLCEIERVNMKLEEGK
ncbi:hypothetical protein ACFW04_007571 [Cataglyphis niger]